MDYFLFSYLFLTACLFFTGSSYFLFLAFKSLSHFPEICSGTPNIDSAVNFYKLNAEPEGKHCNKPILYNFSMSATLIFAM